MMRSVMVAYAALWLVAPSVACAQADYPARPIRIVVPSAAGGGTDIVARVLADKLAASMKAQVFVENKPGAGQMIGSESVAHAPPDGYTLLMAASTLALNPVMYKSVKYDAVKDFAPITQVAALPNVLLVGAASPLRTLGDVLTAAKAKPGELTYASAGTGTSPHMSMELLKVMAGVDVLHVPFRGTTPGVTEVIAGRVAMMFANTLTAKPQVDGGTMRALGVTGLRRAAAMPDVPTIAEGGVAGYESLQWYGLLAPAGTPGAIVDRLYTEVALALKSPDVRERLAADGAEAVGSTPPAFAALIRDELDKWAKVGRAAGIKPES